MPSRTLAVEQARRRGGRRIGTEHLLLGLLTDPASPAARALGVDLATALDGLAALDAAALRAIGLTVEAPQARRGRHPAISATRLTTSARAAVNESIRTTSRKNRDAHASGRLLLALLGQGRPDPVAELLDHLGVDRTGVRARIGLAAA
ncbi:hypothetical protein Aph01nite_45860 [Acrocarpospora phusangensis]|uniref:Clp R domain-containing protein n=1 Tax=Acrocarpospora phusangensis TaxID=1070424 RepID=A0A919QCF5_9ACTN|nr:Clp protease N-terminal domain-containing protein [Acrocarpospora phusangensis]GIH26276.1 hypothetical protein Aph01nite_45860 [Acrocarpospora phusangensis]